MSATVSGDVITFEIKVSDTAIPSNYQVQSIRISQTINRISTAIITLLDGNPSTESFAISASSSFVPGNEISIYAGYDDQNRLLFKGIVTKQSIRIPSSTGPTLEIECKDKAIKMTVGRKSTAWSKTKDSDAISQLINSTAGLTADVSATTTELAELVQYYVTDWDFMLSRAEINSMLVSTLNNTVSVFNPTDDTSPVFTLTYGQNLYAFNAELNALSQVAQVKATAWDYQNQKLISAEASNNISGPGNLSSKELANVVNLDTYQLQTTAAENNDELLGWANAQMLKSELSKITGDARFQGSTDVALGKYLTLKGLGARFDGDHFVSAVRHDISDGNWVTEVDLGLSAIWFVQQNEVESPMAAGMLPGIQGIFNATVKQINDDPDNEYRILVEVALFNDTDSGLWARLANFYSTSGQGAFFLPEVGDEVIVGFLNQDPRYPVILGSMYSQKNKPFTDFTPNEKNTMKGIVSKSQLRMMFDDENAILTLTTPAKNTFILDDKNQQIKLTDQNNNSITMSSSGIVIKSDQSITIDAGQNISLKGTTGITSVSSGGDVSTKGLNIQETAELQYAANGQTAEVKGGVMLTLKAAMVLIN